MVLAFWESGCPRQGGLAHHLLSECSCPPVFGVCPLAKLRPADRMVFRQAYVEVRQMLEANLLRRFLSTDRFKNLRMQRENMQAMMDSPQQTGAAAV